MCAVLRKMKNKLSVPFHRDADAYDAELVYVSLKIEKHSGPFGLETDFIE